MTIGFLKARTEDARAAAHGGNFSVRVARLVIL